MSHELRRPLISIKGSTATVLGAAPAPDPAEMLQFFRIIDEQANSMRGLIADLLDQGRIETGTLSVSPEPVEVAGLVDQARNTFLSGGGRHTLLIDLPEDLPRVLADRERIVQVLNNLLANAARHSPESSPIRVAATRDGVHVAVSVSDEGRGVPPDRLPHLFRKHAGGGTGDPGLRGNGLGLVICRGLVEAHGGRIWAESGGVGHGTRVIFTAPVAEEPRRDVVAAVPGRSRPSPDLHGQTRILVVDDDPQMLRYVRDALTGAGYAVFVTGDPEALSDLIRTHQPRLVLLDVLLPGTDGIELMESVPELAGIPVIFISAYGRDETIVRALDAGAADYIVKPFSPSELTARVRASLRVRAEPEPVVIGELAIDYDARRVTVGGSPVELTATEYQVLRVLSMNSGRVLTFDSLLRQAWRGRRSTGDPKLVRAVVKRLRRKLGDDAANPTYVQNERGVGVPHADTRRGLGAMAPPAGTAGLQTGAHGAATRLVLVGLVALHVGCGGGVDGSPIPSPTTPEPAPPPPPPEDLVVPPAEAGKVAPDRIAVTLTSAAGAPLVDTATSGPPTSTRGGSFRPRARSDPQGKVDGAWIPGFPGLGKLTLRYVEAEEEKAVEYETFSEAPGNPPWAGWDLSIPSPLATGYFHRPDPADGAAWHLLRRNVLAGRVHRVAAERRPLRPAVAVLPMGRA